MPRKIDKKKEKEIVQKNIKSRMESYLVQIMDGRELDSLPAMDRRIFILGVKFDKKFREKVMTNIPKTYNKIKEELNGIL